MVLVQKLYVCFLPSCLEWRSAQQSQYLMFDGNHNGPICLIFAGPPPVLWCSCWFMGLWFLFCKMFQSFKNQICVDCDYAVCSTVFCLFGFCLHRCVCVCVCVRTCPRARMCVYVYVCTCMHSSMHVCVCVCMCAWVHVCMCVCVCVCVHSLCWRRYQ